jgi:taurine dioxygenase
MDAILQTLFDLQERPRFVYEHVWRPGDILMWDNRGTFLARSLCSAAHQRRQCDADCLREGDLPE